MNIRQRVPGLVIAGLLVVSACSGGTATDPTTSAPIDSSSTTAVSATGGSESAWGPLAVVEGGIGMDAVIQGTITITDECVSLDEGGESVLLVWPSNRTQWNEGTATIQFTDPTIGPVSIEDGQFVRFGGGGTSVNEGGLAAQDWLDSITWIAEPTLSCVTDTRWSVSGVLN
mgnify:CR=1 FL=1